MPHAYRQASGALTADRAGGENALVGGHGAGRGRAKRAASLKDAAVRLARVGEGFAFPEVDVE